ncbi:MAG: ATP-binding protein, partial [Chloroflexota bacterium]|nr:ATP-binding protein [Chloroflexota bacterium]
VSLIGKRTMFTSIRWQIIIPYTLLILVSLAGMGIYIYDMIYQAQLQTLEDRLTDDALLISHALVHDVGDDGIWREVNTRTVEWANLLGVRVTIIAQDGTVLGESHQDASQMDNHLDRPEIQAALQHALGSNIRYSQTVKYDLLYVAVPILQDEDVIGFARVSLPLAEIKTSQAQLRNMTIASTVIAASLGVLLSVLIATRVTRPLHALTRETQQITQGELTRHLSSSRRDEVGQLTDAFNTLVGKLQSQIHALQSEQGKLTAVLEQMTDGVVIIDDNGKIILINLAAERMFQTESEIAVDSSLTQVLRHHQWMNLWEECKKTGGEQSNTLELPHQGIFIQGIALPLGDALPEHILMLFQDLTRIRRLETVRRDFISNISHELRTPLASLKALSETLRTGALDDPPAARRFLYHIETEVDALTYMVSELLELTRIESGQVPLKLKSVKPINLLNKARERLGVQAERSQLVMIMDCPKNLPRVLADKPRMGQVLVNLLHNAIKFTPEGGEITLSARQQGDMISFSVQDTGIGIPTVDLPRVFERFYKTDPARSGGGTGLGLAIARHLVEAHGGKIWVESVEKQGSKFFFTIPIEQKSGN